MGWYYPQHIGTRKELVEQLTRSSERATCLKHCTRGNVVWSLWQDPVGQRWIGCDLMHCYDPRDTCQWGYKPLTGMSPFYYTCPISYLDQSTESGDDYQQWQAMVREHHSRKGTKQ